MEWKTSEARGSEIYHIPNSWLKIHYYEALSILFRFENVLRVFVYTVLKRQQGKDWLKTSIDYNGKAAGTIQSLAGQRISQELDMGYISYHIHSPIMQLTAGELVAIVLAEANWPYFKDHFLGKKDIIRHKLLEIIEVRNALAHFRPIKPDDIQLVKQNMSHVLIRIETYLSEMTNIETLVPSNSSYDWYLRLRDIKGTNATVRCFRSHDEHWIKITVRFTSPIIAKYGTPDTHWFKPLTLSTNKILKDLPALFADCIYVTESTTARIAEDTKISAYKSLNFVFNSENMTAESPFIEDLGGLISAIDDETTKILSEPTAQGRFVRSVDVRSRKIGTWWTTDTAGMKSEVSTDDPAEYWGDLTFFTSIVTDIAKYPWMPVAIANDDDVPF